MPSSVNDKNIKELADLIKDKEEQINRLEKMVNAYKNLSDMYNKELIEADRMLQAQEIVQDIMRVERVEADRVIQAQEIVQDMMREEKIEADRMIQAHENLQELTIMEKKDAVQLLEAQDNVSQLSMKELIEKDEIIRKILLINKDIGSILDLDCLLNKIVKSLTDTIKADHGMLFIREQSKLSPKIFINEKNSKLGRMYFDFCQKIILDSATSRKSFLSVNNKLNLEKSEISISSLAVPLMYKGDLLGVLYADTISKDGALKSSDLSSAEIFAGQAAISINNSLLYEKIKNKNRELLKLVNFKNEFINGFSDHLIKPVMDAKDELEKIKSGKAGGGENSLILEKLGTRIERIGNIVQKTLSFGELESSVNELFKDTVNVKDFIEKTVLPGYQIPIMEKKLKIDIIMPGEFNNFIVNSSILRVIFDELLSNAILYNKPNGTICVQGCVKDNYYTIDIADSGVGIKDDEKGKVFQQFYRGTDGVKCNESGAGLGLFMVKNALSYYGGDIKIESTYGKGTKFTISFLAL